MNLLIPVYHVVKVRFIVLIVTGNQMIISEKQIMQLMTIAYAYIATMHRFGEYKAAEIIQGLLAEINDQQSEELKAYKKPESGAQTGFI